MVTLSQEQLRDRIRGGLLGQMLGNLNGLPHEMQYIDEPGNVTEYIPSLPEGARTDDDTDFEWVYIYVMQHDNTIFLSPARITRLWQESINEGIWCSNRYARHLMNLGFEPPLTSNFALNPWAEFNISGQFICETFGLLAPGMPETASRIGLNFTRVTIDMEPAQTTQLFCTMIATAFFVDDIDALIDAGVAALDRNSVLREIIADVRRWSGQYPDLWQKTRQLIKEKYSRHNGAMRDRNGFELNTAATIAALLYGRGDFCTTLKTAFNFGWDADNTAATAGTIIGVSKGYRWMLSQGWQIVDRYKNTKRESMPMDETITSFADRIIDLAEKVILVQGGEMSIESSTGGTKMFKIVKEEPVNVYPLPTLAGQVAGLQTEFSDEIARSIAESNDERELARSAYIAICIDLAPRLQQSYPERWQKALHALTTHWRVLQNIFHDADIPAIFALRDKALAAGLKKPEQIRPVW
jgi:hypothetical protein